MILESRKKEMLFLLLFATSIFLNFALFSYSILDPGWGRTSDLNYVLNKTGFVGAYFADTIFLFLGYVAYLVPVITLATGILLFKENTKGDPTIFRFLGLVFALISLSTFISLTFANMHVSLPGPSGGILGDYIGMALVPRLNIYGATILCIFSFLLSITIATSFSWARVCYLVVKYTFRALFETAIFMFKLPNRLINLYHLIRNNTVISGFIFIGKKILSFLQSKRNISKVATIDKDVAKVVKPKPKLKQEKILVAQVEQTNNKLPSLDLLQNSKPAVRQYSQAKLKELSKLVEEKLLDFGCEVKVESVNPGPVVTRFELTLAPGLKVSKVSTLSLDLARSLSVAAVRVVEIIPGSSYVGLEIPNADREMVLLREVLADSVYQDATAPLTLALGKTISGLPSVVNLAKMPHLLVAGTTGSGKSVAVNVMLLSLIFKNTPSVVRLILIDPKMLELAVYDGIPHLLTPVVTDMSDAAHSLKWCVEEMERRYQLMAAVGVRNLDSYNSKVTQDPNILDPLNISEEKIYLTAMPHIVVIIDEFADMMMVVGKKVEELIARIAQKARASGIHLILATQRPSVDVITGLIKANIPSRVSFQVSSKIDSRTILDSMGAESLLGSGDMLYLAPGTSTLQRIHGAFVSDDEVHKVVQSLKDNFPPVQYVSCVLKEDSLLQEYGSSEDELYSQAVQIVTDSGKTSISYLQRRLKIGYNRSARLIEEMEANGIVSAVQSNGTRELLIGATCD